MCVCLYLCMHHTIPCNTHTPLILIGHLQGASSSYINALLLLDNIKSVLDTVNRFQLAVDNSRNNDFLYCIMLGLYMAN